MQAVVHLIGAAALTALAIYLVVSEPQLRRRYYPFRAIQFPVLVGAAVLVPLNVVEAFGDPVTSWRDYTVDVLTYAVLLCAVLGAVTLRIRTPPCHPAQADPGHRCPSRRPGTRLRWDPRPPGRRRS